jgi:hypothetical protein
MWQISSNCLHKTVQDMTILGKLINGSMYIQLHYYFIQMLHWALGTGIASLIMMHTKFQSKIHVQRNPGEKLQQCVILANMACQN